MAVYVTGDCHGDWWRLNRYEIDRKRVLTEGDIVIVCGDFGIWNEYAKNEEHDLNCLSNEPFTTVFVDGNHENFSRLYSDEFETVDFFGGKAHKIREHIYHLIRGNVFTFEGKKFFCFGGARSHDISDGILDPEKYDDWQCEAIHWKEMGRYSFRIKGVTWWPEEMPSAEEMEFGRKSLEKVGCNVDYIITHCAPQQIVLLFSRGFFEPDNLTTYFDEIAMNTEFKRWYFGHYHDMRSFHGKYVMLFDNVERII